MKNVLLLKGGGSTEHEVSLMSANYIEEQIDKSKFNVFPVEIDKEFTWKLAGQSCEVTFNKKLKTKDTEVDIDVVIPCLHGYPGETGEIAAFFQLLKIPYLGCNAETSTICFNKLLTKLSLELSGVATTPYLQVHGPDDITPAQKFLADNGVVYVKATNQGSSVGCYKVSTEAELKHAIKDAFNFSPFVIIEKGLVGRELEVAVFEYENKWHITKPGEIICPGDFYSYEEKYSQTSHTKTIVEAGGISSEIHTRIKDQADKAISCLKLRHLSRIDFFLTEDGQLYLNEPNTFPGHTEISMFPTMMENYGVKYSDFLNSLLDSLS